MPSIASFLVSGCSWPGRAVFTRRSRPLKALDGAFSCIYCRSGMVYSGRSLTLLLSMPLRYDITYCAYVGSKCEHGMRPPVKETARKVSSALSSALQPSGCQVIASGVQMHTIQPLPRMAQSMGTRLECGEAHELSIALSLANTAHYAPGTKRAATLLGVQLAMTRNVSHMVCKTKRGTAMTCSCFIARTTSWKQHFHGKRVTCGRSMPASQLTCSTLLDIQH